MVRYLALVTARRSAHRAGARQCEETGDLVVGELHGELHQDPALLRVGAEECAPPPRSHAPW